MYAPEWGVVHLPPEGLNGYMTSNRPYGIRRTFPNGVTLGDGLLRTGTRSDVVATYTLAEGIDMLASIAGNPGNRGFTFSLASPIAPDYGVVMGAHGEWIATYRGVMLGSGATDRDARRIANRHAFASMTTIPFPAPEA